jgi:hypothetical protein
LVDAADANLADPLYAFGIHDPACVGNDLRSLPAGKGFGRRYRRAPDTNYQCKQDRQKNTNEQLGFPLCFMNTQTPAPSLFATQV